MRNMLALAISIAAKAFENKLDKAGKPYILHCLRVMNAVDQDDEEKMIIAILHDVPEDCPDMDIHYLRSLGFSERCLRAIDKLTHKPGVSYEDYIKEISLDKDATDVKLKDLKDNSDITRLKGLRKKDFERVEKYHKAFIYLSN